MSPAPSGIAPSTRNCSKGLVANKSTESKKRKIAIMVAMAYGMTSRLRFLLKKTASAPRAVSWTGRVRRRAGGGHGGHGAAL